MYCCPHHLEYHSRENWDLGSANFVWTTGFATIPYRCCKPHRDYPHHCFQDCEAQKIHWDSLWRPDLKQPLRALLEVPEEKTTEKADLTMRTVLFFLTCYTSMCVFCKIKLGILADYIPISPKKEGVIRCFKANT